MRAWLVLVLLASPTVGRAQELGPADLSVLGPHFGRSERIVVNGAPYEVRTSHRDATLAELTAEFLADCLEPIQLGDDTSRYLGCARARSGRRRGHLVWARETDHGLVLVEVIPRGGLVSLDGEAPGGDLPGVPRPPRSTRVLRVQAERGVAAVTYELAASESVLEATLARIEAAGWIAVAASGDRGVVRFRRGRRTIDAVVTGLGERVRITFLEASVEGEHE